MKIALLAPFEEPVPPKKYGGTERVVARLAEELTALGYDVTLLASGDSTINTKLIPCVDRAIRILPAAHDNYLRQALNLRGLANAITVIQKNNFDIVHNHFGWQLLPFAGLLKCPIITTVHGTLDKTIEPTEHLMHNIYKQLPFVSISNSQRRHAPQVNFVATVYNGIRLERFATNDKPDDYLAFLGRVHPQKGLKYAIQIARRTNHRLIIAAKIDPAEAKYFKRVIEPMIDGRQVTFIGEVEHKQKVKLLRSAKALLSPVQWDEPFGIANIEAMACGTPVIAIRRGSMPEIIKDGKTGFLCSSIAEMSKRVADIPKIDRQACRQYVENNFSSKLMTEGYLRAYRKVLKLD